jgi:hypothetical protein
MPYSTNTYSGNGDNTTFTIAFPYLEKDDVTCRVGGVLTDFSWLTDTTVEIDPAPAVGTDNVVFTRNTDIDEAKIDYSDASTLSAYDLDTQTNQLVFKIQELIDRLEEAEATITTITIEAGNLPPVTGSDNGKILLVVDGAWTKFTPETITVLTNYQIDGATRKFQKKSRANTIVISADDESAWTDVHTGGECVAP